MTPANDHLEHPRPGVETLRVLLVDDSRFFRNHLSELLRREGHEVANAADPGDALAIFSAEETDLAVLDYEMPGMNGLELMRAIHARSPKTPVIILTGRENLSLAVSAMRQGAIDFLLKDGCDESIKQALARATHRLAADREHAAAREESKQAQQRLATKAERQGAINELLRLSLKTTSADGLLNDALDVIFSQDFLRIQNEGAAFLVDGDARTLALKAVHNLSPALQTLCAKAPFGHCLCGRAAASAKVVYSSCVDQRHSTHFEGMTPHGHYCVPIQSEAGVLGVVVCYLPNGTACSAEDVQFLAACTDVIAGALQRLSAEEELRDSKRRISEALEREKHVSTRLEETVKNLEITRARADAANRSKSEFLANMSHEIRTPMTAILGFTDVLIEQGDLDAAPPERAEAAQTIKRNGEYLLGLINDILDLSKIEAGKLELETISCSPCQIIAEVDSLMGIRAEAKNLRFNIEYMGQMPNIIHGDPIRLRQILINLIGNAIKFTEVGGVRLITRLVNEDDQPVLQFDVLDTGIGMTEEQATKLFQPFSQADTSTTREFGGTGLGLAISKRLANLLGGEIEVVETQRNAGTRFRLTIPTGSLDGVPMVNDPQAATAVAPPEPNESKPADGPALADLRILLAEDGPDNQRLIVHVLKKAGADVSVAENGKIAADAALEARKDDQPFDVILMDMQMPVMSGYEATAFLRREGYTRPIIALTAHSMASDRQKCLDAGCDEYAAKPINRKKLLELICAQAQRQAESNARRADA